MVPEFSHLLPLPAGILVNIVLSIAYFRLRPLLSNDPEPEPWMGLKEWFLSLPIVSDILKAGVIWVFLIGFLPTFPLELPGLFLLGFLTGILNTLFVFQLAGLSKSIVSVNVTFLIVLAILQCIVSVLIMGVLIQSDFVLPFL